MAVIEGKVLRVFYRNQETAFTVVQILVNTAKSDFCGAPEGAVQITKAKAALCKVSGVMPLGAAEARRYRFSGSWEVYNNKHTGGKEWNLHSDSCELLKDGDPAAMVSYLVNLHGVGPKTAAAIVKQFGEDTMAALLHPELLTAVNGISVKRAEEISKLHRESARLLSLSNGLAKAGIDDFRIAVRADALYGDEAKTVISETPYRLFRDGICSFRAADIIAFSHCADQDRNSEENRSTANSEERLAAGYTYALRQTAQSGDCCVGTKQLMHEMEVLLVSPKMSASPGTAISLGAATAALSSMLKGQDIIREKIGDKWMCFSPAIYWAEKRAAQRINELASPTSDALPGEDAFIAGLEQKFGISYDTHQKEAIMSIGKSSLVIITGGPGTGKTTTMHGVIEYRKAQKPDCKILCLAPTGRAAQRMAEATGMPALTIHRALEVEGGPNGGSFRRNEDNPLDCDTVFVDEFSMVDILLFDSLLRAIPKGSKIALIGDKNQLPSVGPGCVLKDLIECGKLPVVTLALVFRQGKTSPIAANADAIKDGRYGDLVFDHKEFVFFSKKGSAAAAEFTAELFRRAVAKYGDTDSVQILTPIRHPGQKNNPTCCELLNPVLRGIANPPSPNKPEMKTRSGVFRLGDKVMQFRNNYDKLVMNGDCGYITEISREEGSFRVTFGDRTVEYTADEINQIDLSYAVTIHKSQGSEYPFVIIPVTADQGSSMLNKNIIYTGLTRGKATVVFVGERDTFDAAVRNTDIAERNTALRYRI